MRRWPAGVAILLAVAAGSCGGDDLPDGYERFEGEGFSVAYPGSWKRERPDDPNLSFFVSSAEDARGRVARVGVYSAREEAPFRLVVQDVKVSARTRLRGFELDEERDAEVDGADEARLLIGHYRPAEAGGEERYEATQLVALKEPDRQFNLVVSVPEATRQEVDVDAIVESFRVE